jgi:hypothetical protein
MLISSKESHASPQRKQGPMGSGILQFPSVKSKRYHGNRIQALEGARAGGKRERMIVISLKRRGTRRTD